MTFSDLLLYFAMVNLVSLAAGLMRQWEERDRRRQVQEDQWRRVLAGEYWWFRKFLIKEIHDWGP